MKVKFKKLTEGAIVPSYNHATDSGIDFYAIENGVIPAQSRVLVRTGIAWEPESNIPFYDRHFKMLLKLEGRSGLGLKGLDVLGGVVDQDYRGEIKVILFNTDTERAFEYKKGDRIAQGIIYLIPYVELEEVEELSDTERSAKGFGSSDKSISGEPLRGKQ